MVQGVVGGTVLLRKGQLSREVVIVLHDNEEEVEGTREKAAQRSFNFVLKGVRNGELSTSRPTMCKIHVKSQNIDYTGFMDSKPFQVLGPRKRSSDSLAHSLTLQWSSVRWQGRLFARAAICLAIFGSWMGLARCERRGFGEVPTAIQVRKLTGG
jgi:hypothetical protein